MPRMKKTMKAADAPGKDLPKIPVELIDHFVTGPMSAEAVMAASQAFKKALIERALGAELTHHLGYAPGAARPEQAGNQRNGASAKTVQTETGPLRIEVPRDRAGSFEPVLVGRHERRFTGFDDKIIALYARGMTVREIQGFMAEQYGSEVSAELISTVTEEVMAEVQAWQGRPLEPMYPVVFFDALRVKIRDEGQVRNKAIYLALAVLPDGTRDVLGLWIEQTEGAKFWLKVFNDLKTRGVGDILIAVTDGLKGIGEALECGVPAGGAADLHRSSAAQQPELCRLEGAQAAGRGPAPDLHGRQRRGGTGRAGGLRARALGAEVPHDRTGLAPRLGARHPLLRLPAGRAAADLHDQCHREPQQPVAQDHQDTRALPQRRGRHQAPLAGLA